MQASKKFDVRQIVLVGVLSALVFALSSLEIPIAIGDGTRIHFGNIMCLLSGVLFGPVVGGLSAGFGSMIYDLTHPLYIAEFWITFLTKFAMGFVAGWLAQRPLAHMRAVPRALLAGLGGQVLYVALYAGKTAIFQHFVYGNPWNATLLVVAGKAGISAINGLMAVACCAVLAPPLAAALDKAGLFRKRQHAAK